MVTVRPASGVKEMVFTLLLPGTLSDNISWLRVSGMPMESMTAPLTPQVFSACTASSMVLKSVLAPPDEATVSVPERGPLQEKSFVSIVSLCRFPSMRLFGFSVQATRAMKRRAAGVVLPMQTTVLSPAARAPFQ